MHSSAPIELTNGRVARLIQLLSQLLVLSSLACAHDEPIRPAVRTDERPNEVILYLRGAERQAETEEQRHEILRALEDMRTLSELELKQKRYANYTMVPGQWTLATLLRSYFVPRTAHAIDEEKLYRDARDPAARQLVADHIRAIHEERQVDIEP